jgi:hypothetical protein
MPDQRFLALAAIVCALLLAPVLQAAPPSNDNAALLYWQGFAMLRQWDEKQQKIVDDWQTTPLDAEAVKVIELTRVSLKSLHYGAKLRRCDWGYPLEEGPELLLPHLQKSRELAKYACLRARYRFQQGDAPGAVEDVADAMTLGRHAGNDGILISLLVGYGTQNMAIDAATPNLVGLDPAALKRLGERLDALPDGVPLRESVRFERDYGVRWIAKRVTESAGREDWAMRAFGPVAGDPKATEVHADIRAAIQASGGTPQAVVEQLGRLETFFEGFPDALSKPPGEAHAALRAIGERSKANPFAKLLLPQYAKVYDTHARAAARLATLKAAVAVASGGAEKLKDHRDPYGQGPFEYKALPQGFELRSKLTFEGKPVTLTVGRTKQ